VLEIVYTTRFKKDAKRMARRKKNMRKLETLINKLISQGPLAAHYRGHALVGNYTHHRECHIEPDWLLIYALPGKVLRLERTGNHSDLFSESRVPGSAGFSLALAAKVARV